ncbi:MULTISPECIES: hypothetical protein [Fischerella]|uniref:Uncharacterized protein n=3 Tax=Fischerella TaxID=1190 RepID=G6FZT3_9CYAN|nr:MULTISPECIES: hypothetical protein [Fischerella]PLZ84307.1 hypothetical protein CBP16_01435 [Fischerella thermalis WC217]PMB03107.1 hypothetical protein CEN49_24105 [Fischerella thermalis CCMEE 5273]PMB11893.1 hypothetical protein CI592_03070 [Fischerella thermalis CCMEE 5328]BCX06192.1 MAG: hypothetical protein KatS3mg066_0051 [Fischerella sp.]EHC08718.1 hypothetical protein FJSC11DRAFT_4382 [Fischerella thermalis JSC-11]
MAMKKHQYSALFRFVTKFLKYFLLTLVGFAIAYVMSMSVGAQHLLIMILPLFTGLVWRAAIVLLCLVATTVVFESLR